MIIEEDTLPEPEDYKERIKETDKLLAELLIRYYLTNVNDNGKLMISREG